MTPTQLHLTTTLQALYAKHGTAAAVGPVMQAHVEQAVRSGASPLQAWAEARQCRKQARTNAERAKTLGAKP